MYALVSGRPVPFLGELTDNLKDLRNHGDSPHDPTHTYLTMADDVEQFVHEHKLTQPILIGHSMCVVGLYLGKSKI